MQERGPRLSRSQETRNDSSKSKSLNPRQCSRDLAKPYNSHLQLVRQQLSRVQEKMQRGRVDSSESHQLWHHREAVVRSGALSFGGLVRACALPSPLARQALFPLPSLMLPLNKTGETSLSHITVLLKRLTIGCKYGSQRDLQIQTGSEEDFSWVYFLLSLAELTARVRKNLLSYEAKHVHWPSTGKPQSLC